MRTLATVLLLAAPASAPVLGHCEGPSRPLPRTGAALNFDSGRAQPQWADILQGLRPKAPRPAVFQAEPSAVIVAAPGASVLSPEAFFAKLAASDIVFVGEQHDQPRHHLLQLEVLKKTFARDPRTTLAMEMLDITQQAQLDGYLSGKLSEAEFEALWKKAWGYPWAIYRPVFAFAKENHVRAKALNAPLSVVRQIAKGGLSSLTPEQRKMLPARVDPIRDPRYLEFVKKSLGGHGSRAMLDWAERLGIQASSISGDPAREARMLEAMAAWNETMGQSLIDALKDGGPIVVIAGSGHMLYDAGILESVRNRGTPAQTVVLPYPLDGEELPLDDLLRSIQKPGSEDIQLGDYFWLLPKP